MQVQDRPCPVVVEGILKKHDYSITATAHELCMRTDELHDYLEGMGIPKSPPPNEFKEDVEKDLSESLKLLEDFIAYVTHCGDFRNGVSDGSIDEGEVSFSNTVYRLDQKIKLLKNRNNL